MVGGAFGGGDASRFEEALRTRLEQLVPGVRVSGVAGTGPVDVVPVRWFGANFVTVTYRDHHGGTGQAVLGRDHESRLRIETAGRSHGFDGDAELWRLAAEALRIRYSAFFKRSRMAHRPDRASESTPRLCDSRRPSVHAGITIGRELSKEIELGCQTAADGISVLYLFPATDYSPHQKKQRSLTQFAIPQ